MQVLILAGVNDSTVIEDLTDNISSLNYSTALPGLCDKASVTIPDTEIGVFVRFTSYLGKRMLILDDSGTAVWDGLIWSIEEDLGGFSLGPKDLGTVWNYVVVEYSDLLNNGKYAQSAYMSDATSQLTYGIKEQAISYGGMTSSAADKAVRRYIADHADPFSSGSLSVPMTGNTINVKLNAVGYWATTHYRKFQSIITTTCTVQTRMQEIVNQTVLPNAPAASVYLEFFSTDVGLIDADDLVVARATLHVETVGSYFARMASLGDNSFNSWYVGAEIGEVNPASKNLIGKPKIKLWKRPSQPTHLISAKEGKIYGVDGTPVNPSRLRAGDYVHIYDVAAQHSRSQDITDRVRSFVIDSTDYDAFTGTLSVKPEGQDIAVDIILARMG